MYVFQSMKPFLVQTTGSMWSTAALFLRRFCPLRGGKVAGPTSPQQAHKYLPTSTLADFLTSALTPHLLCAPRRAETIKDLCLASVQRPLLRVLVVAIFHYPSFVSVRECHSL